MSPIAVIIVLIAVVLTAVISVFATIAYRKSVSEAKVGSAEEKAREILDDALKTCLLYTSPGNHTSKNIYPFRY